jgi:protoheme IX farnesyltransferase
MSMSSITTPAARATTLSRLADYVELTKPRIAALVLVCVAAGAFVSSWGQFEPLVLIHALVGTSLIAASASGFNHWLERHSDARMTRTASRPLPAGRLSVGEVITFSIVCGIAGFAYLLLLVNGLAALVGAATWITYVLLYTPLKSRTPFNTHVGAVSGALPVLIGAAAAGGRLEPALALFGILLFWQFPHFMAIAWIYREEYARAGLKMSPVVDPTGRSAGLTAVLNALVLLPLSYFAVAHYPPWEAGVFLIAALALGAGQLACALLFCWRRDVASARRLLRASLVYLPAILLLLIALPLL